MDTPYISSNEVASSIPFDNATNGFTASDVQSAIEEAKNNIGYYFVSSVSAVSTSSATYSVLSSITVTPAAGTYAVSFSSRAVTTGASAQTEFAIFNAGTRVADSTREISCNITLLGGLVTISLNTIGVGASTNTVVTVNGSQAIDARYRSANGGSVTFTERNMTLLRLA